MRSLSRRAEFIATRASLRSIVGALLGKDPLSVAILSSPSGRLFVEGAGDLRVSVSHSGSLALIAVARGREIGVDLERTRPSFADEVRLDRVLAPVESASLGRLQEPERTAAFFDCWTRKEAYVKARGDGLGRAAAVRVSFLPGEAPALLGTPEGPEEAQRWTLVALDAGPGYSAALAIERECSVAPGRVNDGAFLRRRFGHPGVVLPPEPANVALVVDDGAEVAIRARQIHHDRLAGGDASVARHADHSGHRGRGIEAGIDPFQTFDP